MIGEQERSIGYEDIYVDMLAGVVASLQRSYKRQKTEKEDEYLTCFARCDATLWYRQAARQRLSIIKEAARFMEADKPNFEDALQKAYHDINEAAIDMLHTLLDKDEKQPSPERSRRKQ